MIRSLPAMAVAYLRLSQGGFACHLVIGRRMVGLGWAKPPWPKWRERITTPSAHYWRLGPLLLGGGRVK